MTAVYQSLLLLNLQVEAVAVLEEVAAAAASLLEECHLYHQNKAQVLA